MSGLRTLHYASRDPFAGSVDMLRRTPYLSRKLIKVFEPPDPVLEAVIMTLAVESILHHNHDRYSVVMDTWETLVPRGVQLGRALYHSGELRRMREAGGAAAKTFNWLVNQVK